MGKYIMSGAKDLHNVARAGMLNKVNWDILTESDILRYDLNGNTPLQVAVSHGFLEQIPLDILRKYITRPLSKISVMGSGSTTLMHTIANYGFSNLPADLLTVENLAIRDEDGCSPLSVAAITGSVRQIPKGLLGENLLEKSNQGVMPLHNMVRHGSIDCVPASILTVENLKIADSRSVNSIHRAAYAGNLALLPKGSSNLENLLLRDINGMNCLHMAAVGGKLTEIPWGCVTDAAARLSTAGSAPDYVGGFTLFHHAASRGYLDQIPTDFLTWSNLLIGHQVRHFGLPITSLEIANTALALAKNKGHLDQLLGVEFPQTCKFVIGTDWWAKNERLISERKSLGSLDGPQELDLF